ncbi:NUDIX hydrolase [Nocardioides pantholopis]|uniref:NUDIX hydrolase n=1 Tax=Nocardioides pantholopis TaxID=2483798 RepID=UPI000FD84BF0|nr:GNAT family N-acetyltransferase [Nocardioides pantholopis]
MNSQPTLTDGTVTLRAWRETDVEEAIAGHDDVVLRWLGVREGPTAEQHTAAVRIWNERFATQHPIGYVIEHDGRLIGGCQVRVVDDTTGELSWVLYAGNRGRGFATRAVRVLADWAMTAVGQGGLGLSRVEARIEPGNEAALRVATRAGLLREGVRRVVAGTGEQPAATEYVVLARLADDPPTSDPQSFRALLNSFLPRKRAISQMLVRDREGRVLLCRLTYKQDWDLPGGVVEVSESPQLAAAREVHEELGLELAPGPLVLTDWLPPWSGWDDAICLVFDGGVLDAAVLDGAVLQAREIRDAQFCTLDEVEERCADFTARRIRSALAGVDGTGAAYTESGR